MILCCRMQASFIALLAVLIVPSFANQVLLNDAASNKRTPTMGFQGMRGKKDVTEPEVDVAKRSIVGFQVSVLLLL